MLHHFRNPYIYINYFIYYLNYQNIQIYFCILFVLPIANNLNYVNSSSPMNIPFLIFQIKYFATIKFIIILPKRHERRKRNHCAQHYRQKSHNSLFTNQSSFLFLVATSIFEHNKRNYLFIFISFIIPPILLQKY